MDITTNSKMFFSRVIQIDESLVLFKNLSTSLDENPNVLLMQFLLVLHVFHQLENPFGSDFLIFFIKSRTVVAGLNNNIFGVDDSGGVLYFN